MRRLMIALTHDWITAWRVRTYWGVRHQSLTGHFHLRTGDTPCLWCVHDLLNKSEDGSPQWLWCAKPTNPVTDRRGKTTYVGCDWGNR